MNYKEFDHSCTDRHRPQDIAPSFLPDNDKNSWIFQNKALKSLIIGGEHCSICMSTYLAKALRLLPASYMLLVVKTLKQRSK